MSREGWKKYKLGDFAEVIKNGYAFKSDEFAKKGIPVIKNIKDLFHRMLFLKFFNILTERQMIS